jgi:hypothetical protein
MTIYETIIATYPEITGSEFVPHKGSILLADEGDGIVYLAKWNYAKPLPAGLKVGK